jgi:hypothetical protein
VNNFELLTPFVHADDISRTQENGRNVDRFIVKRKVPVKNELAGRFPGRREAHPEDNIVKTTLERLDENFSRLSRLSKRFLKIVSELRFEQPVHTANLLLFPELQTVLRNFLTARLAMWSRWEIPPLDRTLFRETLCAFQKKLLAFSSAQPATGVNISCHLYLLPLDDE